MIPGDPRRIESDNMILSKSREGRILLLECMAKSAKKGQAR